MTIIISENSARLRINSVQYFPNEYFWILFQPKFHIHSQKFLKSDDSFLSSNNYCIFLSCQVVLGLPQASYPASVSHYPTKNLSSDMTFPNLLACPIYKLNMERLKTYPRYKTNFETTIPPGPNKKINYWSIITLSI